MNCIYRVMLYGYPRDFREQYGDAMLQLCRDRRRTQSLGPFVIGMLADWLTSVIQERCSAMRTISIPTVRAIMMSGVLLDLLLLMFISKDVWHGDAQTSFAVLLMYGLLVLWATTSIDDRRRTALVHGTRLGLISGAIMFVNTTYGNYFRLSDPVMNAIGMAALCAIFVLFAWAGYRGGVLAGSWCGVVCVLFKVTLAYLLLLTPGPDPSFVATWHIFKVSSGPALGVRAWLIQQTLLAGGLHLLVGPVFGAILGGAGAVAARFRHKPEPLAA